MIVQYVLAFSAHFSEYSKFLPAFGASRHQTLKGRKAAGASEERNGKAEQVLLLLHVIKLTVSVSLRNNLSRVFFGLSK